MCYVSYAQVNCDNHSFADPLISVRVMGTVAYFSTQWARCSWHTGEESHIAAEEQRLANPPNLWTIQEKKEHLQKINVNREMKLYIKRPQLPNLSLCCEVLNWAAVCVTLLYDESCIRQWCLCFLNVPLLCKFLHIITGNNNWKTKTGSSYICLNVMWQWKYDAKG